MIKQRRVELYFIAIFLFTHTYSYLNQTNVWLYKYTNIVHHTTITALRLKCFRIYCMCLSFDEYTLYIRVKTLICNNDFISFFEALVHDG